MAAGGKPRYNGAYRDANAGFRDDPNRVIRFRNPVDGTVAWMTGPATIEQHVVPVITSAAESAGHLAPRIGVGLPVCVTNDIAAARERAASLFQIYGTLPSYRAMLDREGAAGPADVAVVGDEDAVRPQLEHLASIGATDFVANVFGSAEERQRTRAFMRSLL